MEARAWTQRFEQVVDCNRDGITGLFGTSEKTIFDKGRPKCFLFACKPCKVAQMGDNGRREIALKNGEQLLADAGAQAAHIAIRGILPPALAALLQKFAQLFPSSF